MASKKDMESNVRDLYQLLKEHSEKVNEWIATVKQMKSQFESKSWIQGKLKCVPGVSYFFKTDGKENQTVESPGSGSMKTVTQHEQSTESLIIEDIKTRIQILENNVSQVLKSMEQQLSKITINKVTLPTVQVYDREGHVAEDLISAATEWMPNQFKMTNFKDVSAIERNKPLLIVCQSRSRLQPDIDYSLEQFKDLNMEEFHAATVVVHSKEEHALPKMSSQFQLCDIETYKNMCIIDVAFTKELKFYQCKMNETAVAKLSEFLKKGNSTAV